MNRRLLGFDLRLCDPEFTRRAWTSDRRSTYLLNGDIPWPLSVDTMVWPSLFHFSHRLEPHLDGAVDVEPISDSQFGLRLWGDAAAMECAFGNRDASLALPIAVELCHDEDTALRNRHSAPVGWLPIGYDVADGDLVSGLSNTSYSEEERASLRIWSRYLNDFGLFNNDGRAREFKALTDQRVPSHAPFSVYRLVAKRDIRDYFTPAGTPP